VSTQVAILIVKAVVALAIYTMILVAARHVAGQRGYTVASAFMSAAWWFALDAGLALLSYFLTVTAYRNWFPSEYLEDFPVVARWFTNSDLNAADWMALAFTGAVFTLAHIMAWLLMFLMQELSRGRVANLQPILIEAPFFLLATGVFLWLMYQWETPVLALRTAELICDTDMMDNVGGIENVRDIIGASWLLRSLYWLWPVLILFLSYGFTRAALGLHAAIQQAPDQQGPALAVVAPAEEAEVPTAEEESLAVPPTLQDQDILAVPLRQLREPGDGRNGNGHRRVPELSQLEPVPGLGRADDDGNSHEHAGDEDVGIQELIDQLEDERHQRAQAERERDALAHAQALNPLSQPNRERCKSGVASTVVPEENDDE